MILLALSHSTACQPWELEARCTYTEAAKTQLLAMPGVRWVRSAGCYRGPAEALEIVAATLEAAGIAKVQGPTPTAGIGGNMAGHFDERLRGYQADGVSWLTWQLRNQRGALLADEMGLGKTPQAIVALDTLLLDAPRLVVAPAVVVPHWEVEVANWSAFPSAWRLSSWDKAKRQVAGDLAGIVGDEIHYVSNRKTKRAEALQAISAASPGAVRLGLSGTPMTTRPRDLWSPLDWLHPGRWGRQYDFQRRYCNGHYEEVKDSRGARVERDGEPISSWDADGSSRLGELNIRLQRVMLRRTKQQVGAELPPLTRVIDEVVLPASVRKGLLAASRSLDWSGASKSALRDALGAAEEAKIDAAEAFARDALEAGSRVLLLTTRKESAYELGRRLGCPAVTGDDEAATRRGLIADAPCAAATIYSVETGVNLTGFDTIIFVGLDWVPSRLLQAESRIHRIGQDKPCLIRYLAARSTLDEVIRERVISRLDAFSQITGEVGGVAAGLSESLAGGSEDDLLAACVAAARGTIR